MLRCITVTCFLVTLVAIAGPPRIARAQVPGFTVDLVSQPVWHGPDDILNLKVRVSNDSDAPLEGFTLVVGALFRTETRSQLHDDFDLDEQDPVDSFPLSFTDETVDPGASTVIEIKQPVTTFSHLAETTEAGVYPLKVSLRDGAGNPLDAMSTQLIYYPQDPEDQLKTVVVLPIERAPQRGPDGAFRADELGRFPLESALEPGGQLRALVDTLAAATDPRSGRALHIGFAPSPLLIDEINDMADGYRKVEGDDVSVVARTSDDAVNAADFLSELRSALASSEVQLLLTPYSAPDLPSIAGAPDAIDAQIEAATDTVSEVLEVRPTEWLFPPGARLDDDSLAHVSELGFDHTFFSADSLVPPESPTESGCPEEFLSFTCPVSISTPAGGRVSGYTVDAELQDRLISLVRPGDTRLELQQLFAETAMIREEQPSNEDRVVQLTISRSWQPQPRELRILLRGLARAPWLQTVTPEEGLERTPDRATDRRIVTRAQDLAGQPDSSYFDDIRSAEELVGHFGSIEPPDSLTRRLYRNLMVAQSRAWWADLGAGRSYIVETEDEVRRELGKIGIFGGTELEIALTSERGEIPVIIFRNTEYPVRVNVVLESTRLDLARDVLPEDIEQAQERITFEVVARSSGEFPLDVRLTTPDGYEFGDAKRITIRSTAFNRVALGITFGALAFLVLFYVVRALRRRSARASAA